MRIGLQNDGWVVNCFSVEVEHTVLIYQQAAALEHCEMPRLGPD